MQSQGKYTSRPSMLSLQGNSNDVNSAQQLYRLHSGLSLSQVCVNECETSKIKVKTVIWINQSHKTLILCGLGSGMSQLLETLRAHVVCLYSVKHSLHLHSTFSGSSSSFYVTCVILKQSLKFECAPKTQNKTPHQQRHSLLQHLILLRLSFERYQTDYRPLQAKRKTKYSSVMLRSYI